MALPLCQAERKTLLFQGVLPTVPRVATALSTVLPVFCVIAIGYALAGRRRIDVDTLAELALLVTSPALLGPVGDQP